MIHCFISSFRPVNAYSKTGEIQVLGEASRRGGGQEAPNAQPLFTFRQIRSSKSRFSALGFPIVYEVICPVAGWTKNPDMRRSFFKVIRRNCLHGWPIRLDILSSRRAAPAGCVSGIVNVGASGMLLHPRELTPGSALLFMDVFSGRELRLDRVQNVQGIHGELEVHLLSASLCAKEITVDMAFPFHPLPALEEDGQWSLRRMLQREIQIKNNTDCLEPEVILLDGTPVSEFSTSMSYWFPDMDCSQHDPTLFQYYRFYGRLGAPGSPKAGWAIQRIQFSGIPGSRRMPRSIKIKLSGPKTTIPLQQSFTMQVNCTQEPVSLPVTDPHTRQTHPVYALRLGTVQPAQELTGDERRNYEEKFPHQNLLYLEYESSIPNSLSFYRSSILDGSIEGSSQAIGLVTQPKTGPHGLPMRVQVLDAAFWEADGTAVPLELYSASFPPAKPAILDIL